MPTLIDHTYLIRDLSIGQGDQGTVQATAQTFIDKYEEKYLLELFGYNFYKLYKDNIATQRMIDIRDGKEFTNFYNVLDKWKGLRDATAKTSPIANYVYYWYQRDQVSKTEGNGEFINRPEGRWATSPADKMNRAWNEMVCWNKEFWHFMYAMRDVYPEFFEDIRNYSMKGDLYSPIYL